MNAVKTLELIKSNTEENSIKINEKKSTELHSDSFKNSISNNVDITTHLMLLNNKFDTINSIFREYESKTLNILDLEKNLEKFGSEINLYKMRIL